jgi:branched-chain amino acid transport system permease protein
MSSLAADGARLTPSWGKTLPSSLGPVAVALAFAALLQLVVAPFIGPFYGKVLLDIGINIVLAVSLNLVNGFTGQFSIGHAGFMAVGGYTAAALTYYVSMSVWGSPMVNESLAGSSLFLFACIAGGLVASGAGYVVGLPSLRLRGDYLAIVTLGFGEILRVLLQRTEDVVVSADEVKSASAVSLIDNLGGSLGFTGVPFYTNAFWVYAFVGVTLLVAYRLKESTFGRAFLSIRENEIAAEAMGVHTTRFKVRSRTRSARRSTRASSAFRSRSTS